MSVASKKEERRQALVAAALRVLAERGSHRATIRDVASYAGASNGNVCGYVKCEEDTLAHGALSSVHVRAELASQGEGPLERLLAGIRRRSVDRVARVLDGAVQSGRTPPFETHEAAPAIFATSDGLRLHALVIPEQLERLKRSGQAARWCASPIPADRGAGRTG